jgi:hypothetical protein
VLSRSRSRRAAVQKQVEAAGGGLGALRDRSQAAVGSAVETLTPRIEAAKESLAPRLEAAKESLAPRLETAREAAGQAIVEAGEWAAPRIDQAKEQATTAVRERVKPKVTKALAEAAAASAPARKEAKNRTDAALAALRGEVGPPKRKRRWHRVSFLLGAGAVTGVVAALFVRRKEPTYPAFEPTGGGADLYARPSTPTTTQSPAAPITSMNDEIAGTINPTSEPATPPAATADDGSIASTSDGQLGDTNSTIDVTEETVSVDDNETAQTGGRHRKRTRGGQPQ